MIRYFLCGCGFLVTFNVSAAMADEQPVSEQQVIEMLQSRQYQYGMLDQVHEILNGQQFYFKALAADYLGQFGTYQSVPLLIEALSDNSMHVGTNYADPALASTRYRALKALHNLTGENFGFIWNDPEQEREKSIEKWKSWLAERDRVIALANDYLTKKNMQKYSIYRAHRTDKEKNIWGVSLTLDPPTPGAPVLTINGESQEITLIKGR